MKSVLMSVALLVLSTGPLLGQGIDRRGSATTQVTISVTVMPSTGASFRADSAAGVAAFLRDGRIVMENTQPGIVALEVSRAEGGAASSTAQHGSLVASSAVRLVSAGPTRARSVIDPRVARALKAAAQQTGVYTVALA